MSPLGLVPKPNSTKYRMIQDMSFPRNNPNIQSINAGINSDDFPTEWRSFDSTVKLVLSLPPGCVAATFDIEAAYRITPVCPSQQNWLTVSWDGKIYNDRALAFGMASSVGVFSSIADMLVALYRVAGFGPIKKWVDDFLTIRLPEHSWTEEEFIAFTSKLGIPWSIAKLSCFSTVQHYIGFDWNLESKSVTFPPEKIAKLHQLLDTWSVSSGKFTCTAAAKLHGKLVHASSILPLIRPFICSAAIFTSKFTSHRAKLNPTPALNPCPKSRYSMDKRYHHNLTSGTATSTISATRHRLVKRCKHILWDWHHHRDLLVSLIMGIQREGRSQSPLRYWLGRSCCSGTRPQARSASRTHPIPHKPAKLISSPLRQFWGSVCDKQGSFTKRINQHSPQGNSPPSSAQCSPHRRTCQVRGQHRRLALTRKS